MHNGPDHAYHRIMSVMYTTMGIATSAGLDHGILGGLYLIIGLTCLVMSRR